MSQLRVPRRTEAEHAARREQEKAIAAAFRAWPVLGRQLALRNLGVRNNIKPMVRP